MAEGGHETHLGPAWNLKASCVIQMMAFAFWLFKHHQAPHRELKRRGHQGWGIGTGEKIIVSYQHALPGQPENLFEPWNNIYSACHWPSSAFDLFLYWRFFFFFPNFNSFCFEGNKHAMNSVLNSERNQNINYAHWPLNPSMLVPGSPLQIHLSIIWIER